jgi:hypothetical protein
MGPDAYPQQPPPPPPPLTARALLRDALLSGLRAAAFTAAPAAIAAAGIWVGSIEAGEGNRVDRANCDCSCWDGAGPPAPGHGARRVRADLACASGAVGLLRSRTRTQEGASLACAAQHYMDPAQ